MIEWFARLVESTVGGAADAVLRDPTALFIGLVVGLVVGYLAGQSMGRRLAA